MGAPALLSRSSLVGARPRKAGAERPAGRARPGLHHGQRPAPAPPWYWPLLPGPKGPRDGQLLLKFRRSTQSGLLKATRKRSQPALGVSLGAVVHDL
ncbi:hypothetical protein CapIbe_005183 [Capra ibex]